MRPTQPMSARPFAAIIPLPLSLALVLALLTGAAAAAGPAAPLVTSPDLDWPQEAPVILVDGHTMVRLVDLCGCIGLPLEWNAETGTAIVSGPPGDRGGQSTTREAWFISTDGAPGPPGSPPEPRLLDGQVYVPLRKVAEAFGLQVTYDAATYTVRLLGGERPPQGPGGANGTVLEAKGTVQSGLEWLFSCCLREDRPVELTLRVTNTAPDPLTFTLMDGQDFDFVVRRNGEQVWRWSQDRIFTMALREVTIQSGESLEFQADWQPGGPGKYQVEAYYMGISRDDPVAQGLLLELK